ncbi:GNAT family N-acetyltransferase [Consotaella aegiceratis]|uniref:GNAT family N-acetyltransferase n=1 Tax=Consotaella aegiceratis TaxID=3097961 RepID=UPI002F41F651
MQSDRAETTDAARLADLVNSAYRGVGGSLGWTHEAELLSGSRAAPDDIAALIESETTTVLVRWDPEDRTRALGCVAVEMDGAGHCTISMLAVAPDGQAKGLGRAALSDAEAFAAEMGAGIAKITVVRQRESLIAWYERRGYRRVGVENFPYGDDSVGVPLREDLGFIVLEKPLQRR